MYVLIFGLGVGFDGLISMWLLLMYCLVFVFVDVRLVLFYILW